MGLLETNYTVNRLRLAKIICEKLIETKQCT